MHEVSIHNLAHAETTKSNLAKVDLEDQKHVVFAVRELPVIKQGGLGAGVSLINCHIPFKLDLPRNANTFRYQTSLPIGAFATTLTTLSLSLMEWRGVTTTNVYVANFFFLAAMGLVISAQWELAAGNGLAYSIYSAFGELCPQRAGVLASHQGVGFFYAGYAALLTPSFGISAAYGDDLQQYNNAVGFFMTCKS